MLLIKNDVQSLARELPEPRNYFDFPFSMMAFGESLKNSQLVSVDDWMYLRVRGSQATLIAQYCDDASVFEGILSELADYKLKSLNFMSAPEWLRLTKYQPEYIVDDSWSIKDVSANASSNTRSKINRALRFGETCEVGVEPTYDDATDVFTRWIAAAKKRHFMVVIGHYRRYIERHYANPHNSTILGVSHEGSLVGIIGYELHCGSAQITLMKHADVSNHLAWYMWIHAIQHILDSGASKVYCGTTADDLKTRLGFERISSYKIQV